MSVIVWPPTLPSLLSGLTATPNQNTRHSSMASGPKKSIQIDDVDFETINGEIVLNRAQVAIFKDFLKNSIGYGAIPFQITHPVTLAVTNFKIISYGTESLVAPNYFQIPVTLEEVPS